MERTTTKADDQLTTAREDSEVAVDPGVVDELRAMEESTIADLGQVLAAVVVDYDDPETTPATVRSAVLDRAGVDDDRLTASGESVLASEGEGTHALVVVELAGGHVFVDRLPVPGEIPRGPGEKPPSVRRAESFFAHHGDVETLPQLEGEYVEVTYRETGWAVAVPDGQEDDEGDWPRLPVWTLTTLLATGLLAVSLVTVATGTGLVGDPPFAGLVGLSSIGLVLAVGLDWLQLGTEWLVGRGEG